MLRAHDLDDLLGGVGVVGVREHMLRGVEAVGVFVAAQDVDGVAADAHAGTEDEALIDGVANGGVGGACALGAHVALGGEAGQQVGLGGLLGQDHAPGNGFLDGLQVFCAGMQKEMHVRVDEAGEQRGVAQVDDFGALRMVDRRAHGANALALDEDFAGLEQGAGIDLEQARGVEDDGGGGGLLRRGDDGCKKAERAD